MSGRWTERFVAVIVALGEGEVVSYGDVADVTPASRAGRVRSGRCWRPRPIDLPWWRVVRSRRPPGHRPDAPARPPCSGPRACRCAATAWSSRRSGGSAGERVVAAFVRRRSAYRSPVHEREGRRSGLGGCRRARPLISTNAMRMLARASRIVAASAPRRSPSPSTRHADGVDRQRRRPAGRAARTTGGSPPARTGP